MKPGEVYWNAKLTSYAIVYEFVLEFVEWPFDEPAAVRLIVMKHGSYRTIKRTTWRRVPPNWVCIYNPKG